jgi:hypothetical protein
MRIAEAPFFLTFLLITGCTTSQQGGNSHLSAEWIKGAFNIHFKAGPRGQGGRSYSYYEITHQAGGEQDSRIIMESAHTLEGFESVTNRDLKNWIRIVQDPNGKALLIEEEIPNESGPCSTYLWIHQDSGGLLEGEYLLLPSKVTGPPGGINYAYPKVQAINGNTLKCSYSTGEMVLKSIDQTEKSDRPVPAG